MTFNFGKFEYVPSVIGKPRPIVVVMVLKNVYTLYLLINFRRKNVGKSLEKNEELFI